MSDNYDLIEKNELNKNAMGGSELMLYRLYDGNIPRDLIEQFQIIPTRMRELDESKYRILWVQDLVGDPQLDTALKDEGWRRFHRIVFATHWQANAFISYYDIPWSRTIVIQNGIDPLEAFKARLKGAPIKLIYHTTPHRGLNILLSVWEELCRRHDNIELDVYSSFKLYGWGERDEQFKPLFDFCNEQPKINYYGSTTNEKVREAVSNADIFAYPSIWQETSCLCLMEAMSAGLVCVHSDLGALAETSANWTSMYRYNENQEQHARMLLGMLSASISEVEGSWETLRPRLQSQKSYADIFYNWSMRRVQWEGLLRGIIQEAPKKGFEAEEFVYRA